MNNWPDRSTRADQLIFTLNKLYCSPNNVEHEASPCFSLKIEEVLSMLENNSFLDANIKESQLFKWCSRNELINYANSLYKLYNQSSNPNIKITLALLLSRVFEFYLPNTNTLLSTGTTIDFSLAYALENQEYEVAQDQFSSWIKDPSQASEPVLKAIGMAFSERAFQLLDEEIRNHIRRDNPLLFNSFSLQDYTMRMHKWFELNLEVIKMPVRIELTNTSGAGTFLLASITSEAATSINVSIDLWDELLNKYDAPIQVIVRPIKDNGIRFTSIDLESSRLITSLDELFNLRNDNLSLLKAAVIASGIIPPSVIESPDQHVLEDILQLFLKDFPEYNGFEIITRVLGIPRGAGLAVSSNLTAAMLIALMRFSGQAELGEISEALKQEVLIRAFYAEWFNGSQTHFQNFGGLWGGFKEIKNSLSSTDTDKNLREGFICEEIKISKEKAGQILDGMVLVNGGMRQEAGSFFKMIFKQFVTKSDIATEASTRSKTRLSAIKQALSEGLAHELSTLENENFADQVLISPLFLNLYHEQVAERLTLLFGDDIWGYNSTGGHAGSGGVFWIDPYAKELFEKAFVEISAKAQKDLRGQIHFISAPQIFKFQLNEEGASYETLEPTSGQHLIELWQCQAKGWEVIGQHDQVELIKDIFGFNEKLFGQLQDDYKQAHISVVKNASCLQNHINQKQPVQLPHPWSADYIELFQQGVDYLADPLGYVILNGGENTRYGSQVIRGTNPFIYIDGKYCSPIELKMANLRFVRENFQAKVFPVFLNGHFTEKNTRRVLKFNDYFGIEEKDVFHSAHEVIHRIVPSEDDHEFWFEKVRKKSSFSREEELSKQYYITMKKWINDRGASKVYQSAGWNKANTLVSPGNYFSFISMVSDGTLGKLLKRGVRRIIVSSNDNLLATVDPAILAHHMLQENKVTCEVISDSLISEVSKLDQDRTQLLKELRFSNQNSLWNAAHSKPITFWMEIDALLNLLDLKEADLIAASEGNKNCKQKCNEAAQALTAKLPIHPVLKHIKEDVGKGINYCYPVVQFEKLFDDLIALLNYESLLVPKLMRYTQIKSTEDTINLYADQSLEVLQSQITLENTKQQKIKERAVWV